MSSKKSIELSSRETRRKFRERFREWRLKRGISQDELARKAHVPSASVSHFERGIRFPNAETLRRIADALGVSADFLLGRVDDPAGEGLGETDPEFAALFRKFQGMSEEAREEVKEFLDSIVAKDKKGRGRESKN